MKTTITSTLLLCVAALCCLADDQRTFFQIGGNTYSATNGWNLVVAEAERGVAVEIPDTDDEGRSITRLVMPDTAMNFKLCTANHEMLSLNFLLALEWTNRVYQIHGPMMEPPSFAILPPRNKRNSHPKQDHDPLTNFTVREIRWNPTNGVMTSAAVDFSCGKVRFNSDVP